MEVLLFGRPVSLPRWDDDGPYFMWYDGLLMAVEDAAYLSRLDAAEDEWWHWTKAPYWQELRRAA